MLRFPPKCSGSLHKLRFPMQTHTQALPFTSLQQRRRDLPRGPAEPSGLSRCPLPLLHASPRHGKLPTTTCAQQRAEGTREQGGGEGVDSARAAPEVHAAPHPGNSSRGRSTPPRPAPASRQALPRSVPPTTKPRPRATRPPSPAPARPAHRQAPPPRPIRCSWCR